LDKALLFGERKTPFGYTNNDGGLFYTLLFLFLLFFLQTCISVPSSHLRKGDRVMDYFYNLGLCLDASAGGGKEEGRGILGFGWEFWHVLDIVQYFFRCTINNVILFPGF
jgi:hypothetical protein